MVIMGKDWVKREFSTATQQRTQVGSTFGLLTLLSLLLLAFSDDRTSVQIWHDFESKHLILPFARLTIVNGITELFFCKPIVNWNKCEEKFNHVLSSLLSYKWVLSVTR